VSPKLDIYRFLVLLVLGSTAFCILFTTWACYDDEGYVLWTLIHHHQGRILYDEIFTQYGPAFYVLDESLRTILPFAYSTDGQRWQTLCLWLASTAILWKSIDFLAVRREGCGSARRPIGAGVFLFSAIAFFWQQDRLALEPGHPQMWCNLLVCTAMVLLAARYRFLDSAAPSVPTMLQPSFLLGILAGTLLMMKPNVGIFLLAALPAGIFWTSSRSRRWMAIGDVLYTAALVLMPWLLIRHQLGEFSGAVMPLWTTLSLVAVRSTILVEGSRPSLSGYPGEGTRMMAGLAGIALGVGAAILFFLWWSIDRGGDLVNLQRGLLGQHGSLLTFYYHPVLRSPIGLLSSGLLAFASIGFLVRLRHGWNRLDRWQSGNREGSVRTGCMIFFAVICPLLVAINLLEGMVPLVHGLMPRVSSEVLFALSPAILGGWLKIRLGDLKRFGVGESLSHQQSGILVVLATVAALQPLIAYPVPGTQLSLGTLPLLLLLVDGCRIAWSDPAVHRISEGIRFCQIIDRRSLLRVACWSAVVPCCVLGWRYGSRESLGLQGAHRLRLSPDETIRIREWIASIRNADVDSLVFRWHNRPSWYLWTGLVPPHCQLPPSWTYLISETQQEEQLESYRRMDRVLIVDENYAPGTAPLPSPLQTVWNAEAVKPRTDQELTFWIWNPKATQSASILGAVPGG
jgi:hypothetical protein